MFTAEQILNLVGLARSSPSPHNIQPARWRFYRSRIELHEDTSRWLSVGDSSGKDNILALGAAWEGMALALGGMGLALAPVVPPVLSYPPETRGVRRVCAASVMPQVAGDKLLDAITRRRSHRRPFRRATATERESLTRLLEQSQHVRVIDSVGTIAKVAKLHDAASAYFMREPAFTRELYQWMRFSPRDSKWAHDGLSADCVGLHVHEALVARWLMHPASVRCLCALGMERILVAEAAKTRSATALALFHTPSEMPIFDAGRKFYRFWLELTRMGFGAVPMSALVDSPNHKDALLALRSMASGQRLISVFRIGPIDETTPASARLPAGELIIK